jgi:ADP-ribosylglycohydrolase
LSRFEAKAVGCLAGAAVGDALGASTEGWAPEQIREAFGGWVRGIEPYLPADRIGAKSFTRYHKGNGRITDDTLMTRALVNVYEQCRRHLTAYDIADVLVPMLVDRVEWIPDMEREDVLLNRIFLAEKWLVARLHYAHFDPREAGVGNIVNCGAAMFMAPVGVANATNPEGAYKEAIDLAGAHQSSYGREAAGVFAAAVAAAMSPSARRPSPHCGRRSHHSTASARTIGLPRWMLGARAAPSRSKSFRSRLACWLRLADSSKAQCWVVPTTAAMRTPSPRWRVLSPERWAAWRPFPKAGVIRSRRGAASMSWHPG